MHIIDNKKIDMTTDEWDTYVNICRSYDRPNFKGEELFNELFETDDNGMIVFLRPPNKRYTSWEVFMFLMAITSQQRIRSMEKRVDDTLKQLTDRVDAMMAKLNQS